MNSMQSCDGFSWLRIDSVIVIRMESERTNTGQFRYDVFHAFSLHYLSTTWL
jgi:hypothetical protein